MTGARASARAAVEKMVQMTLLAMCVVVVMV